MPERAKAFVRTKKLRRSPKAQLLFMTINITLDVTLNIKKYSKALIVH